MTGQARFAHLNVMSKTKPMTATKRKQLANERKRAARVKASRATKAFEAQPKSWGTAKKTNTPSGCSGTGDITSPAAKRRVRKVVANKWGRK